MLGGEFEGELKGEEEGEDDSLGRRGASSGMAPQRTSRLGPTMSVRFCACAARTSAVVSGLKKNLWNRTRKHRRTAA